MQLLDLTDHKTEGVGLFSKWTIKRDGAVEKGFVVDAELSFSVQTEDEAELAEKICPGAVTLFQRAANARDAAKAETANHGAAAGATALANVSGTVSVKVPVQNVDLLISHVESGKVLVEAGAEMLTARLKATGRKITYVVKTRIHGIESEDAPGLCDALGELVDISVEQRQQVLPFPSAHEGQPVPEIGALVSGSHLGAIYAGLVTGFASDEDGERIAELEDIDTTMSVPVASIEASLKVAAEAGATVDALVRKFKATSKRQGLNPSWSHIAQSLTGAIVADQAEKVGEMWVLTGEIVDGALQYAVSEDLRAAEA